MVQSLNSKVDLVMAGTFHLGLSDYGKIMIGNNAFEFFNDRNVNKFIQIPWQEIDLVLASVYFRGKWIPRFAIQTKHNGTYPFSAKNSKKALRAINQYVPDAKLVKADSFVNVIKRGIKSICKKYLKIKKLSK